MGLVVLSNFGNANTYQLGRRVVAELRATGALQPYVAHPRLAPGFEAALTALLAVYNHWDEAALAALLSRPIDPREHEELDGYRKLHGACTGFAVKEARSPTDATFAMTCERGRGVSHEVPVPPEVPKAVSVAMQLLARWDETAFARAFANAKAIHDRIKQSSTFIGDDAGTCKPGEIGHEVLGWGFDATCQRARLHFYMEMDGPKIKQLSARKLDGEICPVK